MVKNSESLEMYLETMYRLECELGKIRCVDIANQLHVSKPSVNKAVNVLKEQGHLLQEVYGMIHLTDSGRNIGKSIYERHRIITRYLHEILGVDETVAEEDACKMEHVVSDETFNKMKTCLNIENT
ncbi:MAG: metal-dependent transcriptional regulator [Traorella sp.]